MLTSVALRVRPRPEVTRYEGFMLPSLGAGVEALRALAQQGLAPDVTRLSDETETQMSFALAGDGGLKGRLARGYLRFNDVEDGCLAIAGWEGDGERVRTRREEAAAVLRPVGRRRAGPGARARLGPRPLRRRPTCATTCSSAASWSRRWRPPGSGQACSTCMRRSRDALSAHAPLVACHVSHIYPTGASLYFTFLAAQQPGRELQQWREAKAAASDAIVAAGGTITHHHAVGRDHVPWMRAEVGDSGLAVLRAVKEELDPAGILNPGKLLPG